MLTNKLFDGASVLEGRKMFEILFTNADGARVKLARAATPLGVQRAAGVGRCLHHGVVASARCRISEWLAAIVLLCLVRIRYLI